jgi:hypothetical protein
MFGTCHNSLRMTSTDLRRLDLRCSALTSLTPRPKMCFYARYNKYLKILHNDSFSKINVVYFVVLSFSVHKIFMCQSHYPSGLRRVSVAARLLGLCARIPAAAWIFVCGDYCVLLDRGLCIGLITRPEESYRVWWVQRVWSRSRPRGNPGPYRVEVLGEK